MRLHEFQSKRHFARYDIPIAIGELVTTPDEAHAAAKRLSQPVIIKAQVLSSGRDKAQGILRANTPQEAAEKTRRILGTSLQGLTIHQVLIDPYIHVAREIYLAITYDRTAGKPVLVASSEGGIDIEQTAQGSPDLIIREYIKPILGLRSYQITQVASNIELPREHWHDFKIITHGLYECYTDSDATLAEINPLALTKDGRLVALDGKLVIDDNALYRQPDLAIMRNVEDEHDAEILAREAGMSYVKLEGQIGCMVNGAGLAMTTMDMIHHYSAGEVSPANFLDIGGGAQAGKVALALRITLSDTRIRCVLLNIFGGITRCDEVARGILEACQQVKPAIPIIVRLQGTNATEGLEMLSNAYLPNLITATTLSEAAKHAINTIKGQ